MEKQFQSAVDRLQQAKGFALAELCICIVILAIFTSLTVSFHDLSSKSWYLFPEQYLRLQSESILTGERRNYEDDSDYTYPEIRFNEKGNINQARTLSFPSPPDHEIIIELGTGRLVFRE